MHRVLAVLLSVLMCMPLAGCAGANFPPADYSVETVTVFAQKDGNDITLMYPSIAGYPDAAAQELMNGLIASYAHAMYKKQDLIAAEDGGYEYSAAEAVVTLQTKGFLSAYVGGLITSEASGNTVYFSYTLNCDIENGCLYTAEDLLVDYASLAERFVGGDFGQDFGYADLAGQTSFADMLLPYKAEYGVYPQIYFTEDGVGFLIGVIPLYGGYAGYTLPYRRARGALNTENPLAAFVTGQNK